MFAVGVLLLGLANSWLNPGALQLGRDYFPAGVAAEDGTGEPLEHGYQTVDYETLASYQELLFEEPPYVVVLDARSAAHYEEGHIPGAYLLDHYHQDDHMDALLPLLQDAPMIVVYCTGGDCEDSIFLCNDLVRTYGIYQEALYIFEGGITAWEEQGAPLQEGARR
jgi:rhodanese-related sulfurtransferase